MSALQVLSMPELGADPVVPFQPLLRTPPGLVEEEAAVDACAGKAPLATEDGLESSACAGGRLSSGKSLRIKNQRIKQRLQEVGCRPAQGGGEKHGQQGASSFPCLLGRLGVGVAASAEGEAPGAAGPRPEGLHSAAAPAATKPPGIEAAEASRRSCVESTFSHQTAGGSESGSGHHHYPAPWQALFPEAADLGIGTSPPAGFHSAIPGQVDLDSLLPMKVSLPCGSRLPASPSAPCPAFDHTLGPPAPQSPVQPLAPPPGLDAPASQGAVAEAVRHHITSLANSSFATGVLGTAPGVCTAAPRLSTCPVPATPCVSPALALQHEHLRRAADLRAYDSPMVQAPMVQACPIGATPGLCFSAPSPSACAPPLQLGGYLPAPVSPSAASPVMTLPVEHFRRAEDLRAYTSPVAEAPSSPPSASPTLPPQAAELLRRASESGASSYPSPETSPAARSSPCGDGSRERRFTCKFVFSGFDLERDADFELVPRLIGRGGVNMRDIAKACDGKVRIRGRGSGHREQQKGRDGLEEADVPLQIALSCKDRVCFEEGRKRLVELLGFINAHFERYCRKKGLVPAPVLYGVVGGE